MNRSTKIIGKKPLIIKESLISRSGGRQSSGLPRDPYVTVLIQDHFRRESREVFFGPLKRISRLVVFYSAWRRDTSYRIGFLSRYVHSTQSESTSP
jgi:hypothetical protein